MERMRMYEEVIVEPEVSATIARVEVKGGGEAPYVVRVDYRDGWRRERSFYSPLIAATVFASVVGHILGAAPSPNDTGTPA